VTAHPDPQDPHQLIRDSPRGYRIPPMAGTFRAMAKPSPAAGPPEAQDAPEADLG